MGLTEALQRIQTVHQEKAALSPSSGPPMHLPRDRDSGRAVYTQNTNQCDSTAERQERTTVARSPDLPRARCEAVNAGPALTASGALGKLLNLSWFSDFKQKAENENTNHTVLAKRGKVSEFLLT